MFDKIKSLFKEKTVNEEMQQKEKKLEKQGLKKQTYKVDGVKGETHVH
jgi:hypothetical protein